jgi:hypothetical protein
MMCDSPEISKLPVWPALYLSFETPGGDPVVYDTHCDEEFSAIGRGNVFQVRMDAASVPRATDA